MEKGDTVTKILAGADSQTVQDYITAARRVFSMALQAKLLRVLQEGEIDRVGGTETIKVDVRVLATTNRDLEGWVKQGKFRQDLYFRLNVIPLRLPSLRERGDDVLQLAKFFMGMRAMPTTTVQKITGVMIIFIRLINASPSGFNFTAISGEIKPNAIPSAMPTRTLKYSDEKIFLDIYLPHNDIFIRFCLNILFLHYFCEICTLLASKKGQPPKWSTFFACPCPEDATLPQPPAGGTVTGYAQLSAGYASGV